MANSKLENLSDADQAKIIELVEAGDRPLDAFGVVGLSRATFFRWQAMAREGVEPHASFETRVACAISRFKSRARETILGGDQQGLGFGPAKAHLEVMARRFSREWSPKLNVVLEEAESIFFDELNTVCADADVFERVRQEQNLRPVYIALCERLAGRVGEEETAVPASAGAAPVH